jgi:AraC-like DNA-binding protein
MCFRPADYGGVAGETMNRTFKTYSLSDRAMESDFGIHDERDIAPIEQGHRHEYFQVQLNLAGHAQHHIGATVRALEPGSLSFVLPYRVHRVLYGPGSRYYFINFSQRFLHPELEVDPLDLEDVPLDRAPELAPFVFQEFMDFVLDGPDLEMAREACGRMTEENSRQRFCSIAFIRANLLLLLGTVCRRHESEILQLAAAQAQRTSRREALSRVVRYVRENLTRHITMTDAAAAVHLSPIHLAHLLKKETGKTFTSLVTERRMEKAQELLVHTTMRISKIADAVGFEDEAYFTRRFKQRFKTTPRAYRSKVTAGTLR